MELKIRKDKRLLQTIVLSVIALLLLFFSYFIFINKNNTSTDAFVQTQTGASELEVKLCSILSEIEGVGKINAYINQNNQGEAVSAVLVFEGANRLSVRMDVLKATSCALGISQKDVAIYQMTK